MEIRIENREQVDSTNSIVKHQITLGQSEGFVCRALRQSGGYGRQGRTWVSLEGGSYQSILLRPKRPHSEWPTLTLVVGLAVCRALLDICGGAEDVISIKWPNDIVTPKGKLVGISCEAQGEGVCVGVGVNVIRPTEHVVLPGKNSPAYVVDLLKDEGIAQVVGQDFALTQDDQSRCSLIEMVSDKVLQGIDELYEVWQCDGFVPFLDDYREANGILGRFIQLRLVDGGILTSGRVLDINEDGQLVIEQDCGAIQVFSSGEVHIL